MLSWIRSRFSRRLAVAFSLVCLVGVLATSALVGISLRRVVVSELTDNLQTTAAIVGSQVRPDFFLKKNSAELSRLAHDLAAASGARLTFIATDGVVLGDSSVPLEGLPKLENHRDRPEIRSALSATPGSSVRLSHTVHERLLYVAVPVASGGKIIGVVRSALPMARLEAKISSVQRRIELVTLLLALLVLFVALALSRAISRPLREMSEVAGRLAAGDFAARVNKDQADEHGLLADTLNALAASVQAQIQELSHDKAQLSAILANMSEAVVAVDAGGRVIAVNPALAQTFGIDSVNAPGKLFLEVLRHHQIDELVQYVMKEHRPMVAEVRTFVPDEHIFEAQVVPLMEGDRFAGVLAVLHDISRVRRLEQIRRDFVANVSHELRTPLASIKGFAETLQMGAIDDPKNRLQFIQSIEKQADRMTSLVKDLLDLAAIEAGKRVPKSERVSLPELLAEVLLELRPQISRRKIKVSLDLPADLVSVAGDRDQMRQVFINLLDNAVKFNREEGSVVVSAVAGVDQRVEVRVTDAGVGIPAQDLPRIFERFYRVDKARSQELGGTGLGLSIVKHLVEANGGTVRAESTVGHGSSFIMSLRAHQTITPAS